MAQQPDPAGEDVARTPSDPQRPTGMANGAPDRPERSGTPATDLEDVLRRRVPLRNRVIQAAMLFILGTVALGLVVRGLSLVPGAATTTPVPLGPVLLLSNVSSGKVTLNGAPLAGSPPLVVTFRRGLNTIAMTAPPFRPRTCHIQWPSRRSDGGCALPTSSLLRAHIGGQSVLPRLVVVLRFGAEDLPSDAQAQALASITDVLRSASPQTTVPAGEHIATGRDTSGGIVSQRASTPLQAALLATATSFDYIDFPSDLFCADPECASVSDASTGQRGILQEWVGVANVTVRWQFSSGAGLVAHSAQLPAVLPGPLLLTLNAQQAWTVDQGSPQQLGGLELPAALTQSDCATGYSVLNPVAQQHGDLISAPLPGNSVEGCAFQLQTPQGVSVALFVWRFGVLLAADGPAHALIPGLPLASAADLRAVGD